MAALRLAAVLSVKISTTSAVDGEQSALFSSQKTNSSLERKVSDLADLYADKAIIALTGWIVVLVLLFIGYVRCHMISRICMLHSGERLNWYLTYSASLIQKTCAYSNPFLMRTDADARFVYSATTFNAIQNNVSSDAPWKLINVFRTQR